MATRKKPYQIIQDMTAKFDRLTDAEILAKLSAIPPLAEEDDPCWADDGYWRRVAYPYLALWNVTAARKLRPAVPLILDRACFGDPGEIMRNLCHAVEAIVKPEWSALLAPCLAALKSPRAGTRLWAAHELGRLRDPRAIPALEVAANDDVPWFREWAVSALDATKAKVG